MPLETGRFQQADRILCTQDFIHVAKTGKRKTSTSFVVVIAPRAKGAIKNSDGKSQRLGITVSKRVGNSVIRNRVKRRIREWFRQAREELPDGSDIVVIARQTARDLQGSDVAVVLNRMIRGAGAQRGGRTTAEFR